MIKIGNIENWISRNPGKINGRGNLGPNTYRTNDKDATKASIHILLITFFLIKTSP